jgi:hypothetical protein
MCFRSSYGCRVIRGCNATALRSVEFRQKRHGVPGDVASQYPALRRVLFETLFVGRLGGSGEARQETI